MRIKRTDTVGGEAKAEAEDLPDHVALEQLLSGRASLESYQTEPPFELLSELAKRAGQSKALGPVASSPDVLDRFANAAIVGGLKQHFIEGYDLRWFAIGKDFNDALGVQLSQCSEQPQNLFAQVRSVLSHQAHERSNIVKPGIQLTDEQKRSRGLIPYLGRSVSAEFEYHNLGPVWRSFYDQLIAVEQIRDATIEAGLRDARILCAEGSRVGSHFVPPRQAVGIKIKRKASSAYHFCFSADLPDGWFASSAKLRDTRKDAAAWMDRVVEHFAGEGRRPNASDLIDEGAIKFDLTPNAAKAAWKDSSSIGRLKAGQKPREERVSTSEIKMIE